MTVDPPATEDGIEDAGELFLPAVTGTARPDPRVLPASPVTRFAPAPTGYLHLGHLVNVLYVWGIARATGGRVVLRIEDHDRQRSTPGVRVGAAGGPRAAGRRAGRAAGRVVRRRARRRTASPTTGRSTRPRSSRSAQQGLVYACTCARSTFAAYEASAGRPWRGIGCPGRLSRAGRSPRTGTPGCASRSAPDRSAGWTSSPARWRTSRPATGDPLVRDRLGNWTYAWCVVVDDARHGIDLVIRGRDLMDATPVQLRLARLLGRETPPRFLHHPLIRRVSGQKLSKAAGDTAIRSLLDAGRTPAELFGSSGPPGRAARDRRNRSSPATSGRCSRA